MIHESLLTVLVSLGKIMCIVEPKEAIDGPRTFIRDCFLFSRKIIECGEASNIEILANLIFCHAALHK